MLTVTVMHRGQITAAHVPCDATVAQLGTHLQTLTGVSLDTQQLMLGLRAAKIMEPVVAMHGGALKPGRADHATLRVAAVPGLARPMTRRRRNR